MKLTGLDAKEIPRYTYDEDNNANRVVLVGDFDVAGAIKESLKDLKIEVPVAEAQVMPREYVEKVVPGPVQRIEVPFPVRETVIERVEVPVIVKEVEKIEVPVITQELEIIKLPYPVKETVIERIEIPVPIIEKQVQLMEVEKPIYIEQVKVIEIEKPVMVKEVQLQRVEVPVVIKEKEIQVVYQDKLNYKLLFALQTLTLALIVLSKFLGK